MAKVKTSIMLTRVALELLKKLAERSGISMSATLEIIIREKAKTEQVTPD